MHKAALAVAVTLVTFPLYARDFPAGAAGFTAPVSLKATKIDNGGEMLSRLRAQIRGAGAGAQAIVENRSGRAVIIPAAGNAPGAGGEHFQSDVTLVNYNEADQNVAVIWVPNGNVDATEVFAIQIPARPPFTIRNFVGTVLERTGIGALVFIPFDQLGEFDTNAAIDAYSRIWTPQPNNPRGGTVSQPFAGVDHLFMEGEYEGIVLGLRQDAEFRTNFGIVNTSDFDLTFSVTVIPDQVPPGALPERVITVPSGGMVLQSIPAGMFGTLTLLISVENDVPNDDFAWIGFASSTDNVTGDGWVSIAAKPYDDDDLDTIDAQ